ncbi:MAG TPA: hypothetical protein VGH89_20160 [Pseudonocardia sp.]|jgi:hypothetical protein
MSTATLARPTSLFIGAARATAAGFMLLAAALAVQLWRHDALLGGAVARAAFSHSEPGYQVPHFVANGVSVAGGTVVVPVLLLALAGVVAVRSRRWAPILLAGASVLLTGLCVTLGKGLAGTHAISGPATVTIVCWGTAAWLVRGQLGRPVRRALHLVAASAALVIGIAQLYLGHPLLALLVSWLLGAIILTILTALLPRRTAPARPNAAPA